MHLKPLIEKHYLFYTNLSKLKWVQLLYIFLLAFHYPLSILFELNSDSVVYVNSLNNMKGYIGITPSIIAMTLLPILVGILTFGFLHNAGISSKMHSYPVTRSRIFIEHYLSGASILVLPHLLILVMLFGINVLMPQVSISDSAILLWFCQSVLISLSIYAVSVFSSMMIGTLLVQAAFTIIIFLLPLGLISLISTFINTLMKGVHFNYGIYTNYLSPLVGYLYNLNFKYRGMDTPSWFWSLSFFYGLIFTFIAYKLYLLMKVENCEKTVLIEALIPYLKWLGVFCFMLVFGNFTYELSDSSMSLMWGSIAGIAIGYVLLEMILQKTISCKLSLKELSMMYLILLLTFSIPALDVFNLGDQPLAIDQIQSVDYTESEIYTVNRDTSINSMLTSTESKQAVYNLYQATRANSPKYFWNHQADEEYDSFIFQDINGEFYKKTYRINHEKVLPELLALYQTEDFLLSRYPLLNSKPSDVISLTISSPLGNRKITDQEDIARLITVLKDDVKQHPELMIQSDQIERFMLEVQIPYDSESNSFADTSEYEEDKLLIRRMFPVQNQYTEVINCAISIDEIADVVPEQGGISKVLIQSLNRIEPDKYTHKYYDTSKLEENESDVETITSKDLIDSVMKHSIYYSTTSSEDYKITIYYEKGYVTGFIKREDYEAYNTK